MERGSRGFRGSGSTLRRLVIATALIVLLPGCLSIPVSTLYQLSKLDEKAIDSLDPTEIRAVIEAPDLATVDPAKIRIGIEVKRKGATAPSDNDGEWPVDLVASGHYVPLPVPPPKAGRSQHLFKLSPAAEAGLGRVLAARRQNPEVFDQVDLTIKLSGTQLPPGAESMKVSAWLQLRKIDGPLLLIDRVTIDKDDLKK